MQDNKVHQMRELPSSSFLIATATWYRLRNPKQEDLYLHGSSSALDCQWKKHEDCGCLEQRGMDMEGVSMEHTQKQQNTKPRGQSIREW